MRRISLILFIVAALAAFLVLAFCAPRTSAQDAGDCIVLRPDGTWSYIPCEWPTAEVRPTDTPTPSATPSPTATPTNTPSPTSSPTTVPTCYAIVVTDGDTLSVRDKPWGTRTGTVPSAAPIIPTTRWVDQYGDWWYGHHTLEVFGYSHGDYLAFIGDCTGIEDVTPAQNNLPANKRGVHLLTGANCGLLLTHIADYGNTKGISGNEDCIKLVHAVAPDVLLVWRNWVRLGYGYGDGPPQWGQGNPRVVADQWWVQEYATWEKLGLLGVVDYFEYRNELSFEGEWEIAFDLRIIEHANTAGVCLAMFSDGYGNPTLIQFDQRTPVLDAMLAQECQPGRHHVIAAHSYSRYDSGPWLFDRWLLQRDYWRGLHGPKYDAIQWLFTEFGLRDTNGEYDGRGVADCVSARTELSIIDAKFAAHEEVIGYQIFGYGSLPPWYDWSACE